MVENGGEISVRGERPAYCYSRVIKMREGPDAGVCVGLCVAPPVSIRGFSVDFSRALAYTEAERKNG